MINNKTELNMVIGYPLEHSLSPILHNTVYQLLNLNSVMLAQPSQNLATTIEALKTLSIGYIAVTMPFKKDILAYLDVCSKEVENLNAVNTVVFKSGKLYGHNTDIDGIRYALRNTNISNKNILIIGAGGAAYAAAYYLKQNNANIHCWNRTHKHALQLTNMFGGKAINKNQLNDLHLDVIINTTPLGMFPSIAETSLPDYEFHSNQTVFDMVYNPIYTSMLIKAKAQNAICISGLDMFIGQGIKQIELWSNTTIDIENIIPLIKSQLGCNTKRGEI